MKNNCGQIFMKVGLGMQKNILLGVRVMPERLLLLLLIAPPHLLAFTRWHHQSFTEKEALACNL